MTPEAINVSEDVSHVQIGYLGAQWDLEGRGGQGGHAKEERLHLSKEEKESKGNVVKVCGKVAHVQSAHDTVTIKWFVLQGFFVSCYFIQLSHPSCPPWATRLEFLSYDLKKDEKRPSVFN